MTRAWRIEHEGALYHILSRGNERRNIVVDDKDRSLFLDTAGEMSQRFEVDICAYVLMDNHLLIRTRRANLSKSIDSETLLIQAAEILNCRLDHFRKTARVSQSDILDRDMLIYLMWQSGQLTNVQIAEKFGLTYSAVSRRVGVIKNLLCKNKTLQNKFNRVKSLIKI